MRYRETLLKRVERGIRRFVPIGRGLKEFKEIGELFRVTAKDVDELNERVAALEKQLDEAGNVRP